MALPKREDWFKHQFRAREDEKLILLKIKHESSAPVGVYWQLVELIYENDGYIKSDINVIAYKLGDSVELVSDVIKDCFNLTDDGRITHNTIIEQLELRDKKYQEKSKKGKENADKRWEMERQKLLDLYQTHNKPMDYPYQSDTNSILDPMGVDARVESIEIRDESIETRDKSYIKGVLANSVEAIPETPIKKKLKLFQIEQMYPDLSTPEHYKLLNNQ